MTLYEALRIDPNVSGLISLVGASGKPSTMFRLAREFKGIGKKVLVTTTTNIASSEASQADNVIIDGSKDTCLFSKVEPGTITCLGGGILNDKGKFKGVEGKFIYDGFHVPATLPPGKDRKMIEAR